jgi:hypothetical protein
MHRSMNNLVWRLCQQPLTSTRREVLLAFEDRLHGPRWESRRSWVKSVTRAEAVDAPGVGGPPNFGGESGGRAESSGVGGVT